MKKVLSLALVLCMAIACFAFAPTSAEIYWGNILTTTEESVSMVWDMAPWGAQAGEGFLSNWSFPGGDVHPTYSEGNAAGSQFWKIQKEVLIDGENRYGDAQGLVADLSKSGVTENPGAWGIFLNVGTDKVEAGKTYTFFYMIKGSDNFGAKLKAGTTTEGNYANNMAANAPSVLVEVTTDWQLVKCTFTAAEGKQAMLRIVLGEAEEIETGLVYVDGIAMVEGDGADIDATYYANNYKDPMDIDGDKDYPDEDFDIDGDEIPNQYDTDIDADGLKNVWDRDIDGDKIANGDDDKPFGFVTSFVVIG